MCSRIKIMYKVNLSDIDIMTMTWILYYPNLCYKGISGREGLFIIGKLLSSLQCDDLRHSPAK